MRQNEMLTTIEDEALIADLSKLRQRPNRQLKEMIFDYYVVAQGPIGPCFVVFSPTGVRSVFLTEPFGDDPHGFAQSYGERFGRPILAGQASVERLEKALHRGSAKGLSLDLSALTLFEQSVLKKTQEIPPGQVRPYGWIAKEIDAPRAVRAVGTALARNPVPFVVPCHRVVRSDGTIGNYGFGPHNKAAILSDEGVLLEGSSTLGPDGDRFVASDTTGIVCYPTCHHARRIGASHRVGFTSLEKAHAAGFRPCRTCRPI